ncbi:MAG: hypothetical protein GKR86_04625, partial [Ilumatobacter sp.]|nr:hypothetical protein [Ilumatobacter sp.]
MAIHRALDLGDDDAPYAHALGRATTDGAATDPGTPVVETGDAQRLLTDEFGRLWTRTAELPDSSSFTSLIPQAANAGVLTIAGATQLL